MGKPIVMGRRTFDSIGRPLPGRVNIVVSRDPEFTAAGIHVASSFSGALELARQTARDSSAQEIVVIGGSQIYARALPIADRLYLTRVHAAVAGDALLPAMDWSGWEEVSRERHAASAGNPYDYSFVVFNRRRN
jgi:dihydrofolate reductase